MSDVVAKHRSLSRTLYLDGTFVFSSGPVYPVINPATEEQIGEIAEATPQEIERAIEIAAEAQQAWWARSGAERADIMRQVSADVLFGLQLGVEATPTVVVEGLKLPAVGYLETAIRFEREKHLHASLAAK